MPRNVIEKRHKIYKILGTSLAYDFFGSQVWEESIDDAWLITSLRERIGDRFKRLKCGQHLYRYHLMKTIDKFFDAVKMGAERFALTSQYVSHFSEIEEGQDIYLWKCQLIMHIVETILGETHFCNVVRKLYQKSTATNNKLVLFKKILKELGIKFTDIQKNWIDATSCPLIYCHSDYNKRSNQVNITLQQHSAMKLKFMVN